MPYEIQVHRYNNELVQPWLLCCRGPIFRQQWWHMVDIDNRLRSAVR